MTIGNIKVKNKELELMKPYFSADYCHKTVLTNSVWEFVELQLSRENTIKSKNALMFWKQAQSFYTASKLLPINSKPLTSYYCCLNAAKALLAIKRPATSLDNISHGVTTDRNYQDYNTLTNLKKTYSKILGRGVLYELSMYMQEDLSIRQHYIYDLMYNLPCIHRAFSITYNDCTELFIPIKNVKYVYNTNLSQPQNAWVEFAIEDRYLNGHVTCNIPHNLYRKATYNEGVKNLYCTKKRFKWQPRNNLSMQNLNAYHDKLRCNFYCINGEQRLWYIKKHLPNNHHIINKSSLTLIFAIMHWMSELVRYNPAVFATLLTKKANWIIHEFADVALQQFIDEISCEITGTDIMCTGHRK